MSGKNITRKVNNNTRPWIATVEEFPKDKDGVIYVRQSSLTQQQQNIHSFEMQTDKFLQHFRNIGCTGNIDIIPDDEALSGTLDIHKRPGMTKMVLWIKEKRVAWIAAVAVNRFTRDPWLITPAHLMKLCYESDIWVATLRMFFNFKDEYCQRVFMLEAEEAARNLKWMKIVLGGGRSAASDKGLYDGRWVVPGYMVDRTDPKCKKYIIYRPHAEIVSWLFKRFFELDGNFPALCREVDKMPYLFPPFEEWVDKKNVKRLLIKPIAEGMYAGYYKPTGRGLASILTNPVYLGWWIPFDGGLLKENHEAILKGEDEHLFWYAHKRLSVFDLNGNRQKPMSAPRNGRAEAILKKVIFDELGNPMYATQEKGQKTATYSARIFGQLTKEYRFQMNARQIDEAFLEKFFEHLRAWKGCEDWADRIEQLQAQKQARLATIEGLIAEAQSQWRQSMALLKNPKVTKTEQMEIDLAQTCAGLEGKIAEWQADLDKPASEEEEDELMQYQIYTLLPDLMEEWSGLPLNERLRFIGSLVKRVILTHVAPGWIKMEIIWKRTDWQVDVGHIRKKAKTPWTKEEETILKSMYPTEDTYEIMKALPQHPWYAIRVHAYRLPIKRERREEHSKPVPRFPPAYADTQYAQEHHLNINKKKAQWSERLPTLSDMSPPTTEKNGKPSYPMLSP